MKNYTVEQHREYVRNMSTEDLMHAAEIYNDCKSSGGEVEIVRNIINEEVERRIMEWELQ